MINYVLASNSPELVFNSPEVFITSGMFRTGRAIKLHAIKALSFE